MSEPVTNARFTLNRHACAYQCLDITIDGSFRNTKVACNITSARDFRSRQHINRMYESRRSLHDTHPAGCIVVTPGTALSESMFSIVCKQTAQVKFCPLSLVILLISLSFQAQARLKLNEDLIQKSVFSVLSDGQLVGSGFIIDSKGYALTAAHLVDEEARSVDIVSRALGVTRARS